MTTTTTLFVIVIARGKLIILLGKLTYHKKGILSCNKEGYILIISYQWNFSLFVEFCIR